MAFQLTFLNGARAGQMLRFTAPQITLGRDPRSDVAFDPQVDLLVSGRHLTISVVSGGFQALDTSSNGTFINGQRLTRNQPTMIAHGSTIELGQGGPQLRFDTIATAQAQPSPAQQAYEQEQNLAQQQHAHPMRPTASPSGEQRDLARMAAESRQRLQTPQPQQPSFAESSQPPPPASPDAPTVVPQSAAAMVGAAPRQSGSISAAGPAIAPASLPPSRREIAPTQGPTMSAVKIAIERVSSGERRDFEQPVIRIGRDPSADINFDPQTALLVSYSHAKIMVIEGEAVLFDLDSTNGTFVDGKQISRYDLKGGETMMLGHGGPQLRVHLSKQQVSVAHALAGGEPIAGGSTVFGASAPVIPAMSMGDAELLGQYAIDKPQLEIGRENADIVLDSMYVSSRHATISNAGGALTIKDHSVNGTFVNGEKISEAQLQPGAEFVVGPYVLKYDGSVIKVFDTRTKTWVDALGLCRIDARTKRNFLDEISLKIQPGEFVCILGPSGCGKSTLLKSLNGYTRADVGTVLLNNIDFYRNYEQLKHQVGYVPQDDIIHPQLSIERTLHYAAKLRLPPGTSSAKRRERIDDVLSQLELQDHRAKPVYKLSGGQRKRVSIGVELLTEPAIIYLDEPTSGLDPNLEEKMMLLLRELTLRGKTVVTVTHTLDNIHLADKVTFLVAGKLAYFGRPEQAKEYFEVERLPEVYKRFDAAKGDLDGMKERFKQSPVYQEHIASQLSAEPEGKKAPAKRGKRIGPGSIKQFLVLTQRYVEIITRDVRNTLILLLQAPLVALFIAAAVKTDQPSRGPSSTMFLIMSLSALWFGTSNAAREITKEDNIYARERMVNLRVLPYVASKFFVLQFLALLQVGMMLGIVYLIRSGYTLPESDIPHRCLKYGMQTCSKLILDGVPGDFWLHLGNLYLTALNGIALGLLVSAIASNSDKAMSLVPLILIPQVLFSGSFGVPKPNETLKRGVGYAMALNWSLDQSKRISMCTPDQEKGKTGCTTCIHAYDPFKYKLLKDGTDQPDDARCANLEAYASNMTEFPETLEVVEDGLYTPPSLHGKGPARLAHKSFIPLAVLGGYNLLLFILVCIFVRLKDRQNR